MFNKLLDIASQTSDIARQARSILTGRLVVVKGQRLIELKDLVTENASQINPRDIKEITGFYNLGARTSEQRPIKPKLGPPLLRRDFLARNEGMPIVIVPQDQLKTIVRKRKI